MIVYTGGTFDLLHAGHVDFLRICKKIADGDGAAGRVVVALNRDAFVTQFKGKAPICNYAEREAVLLGCRYVDEVTPNFGDQDSKPVIEQATPDFIIIGADWATRDYYKQMQFTPEWLDERGIVLLYVPRARVLSSTSIKARCNE